MRFSWIKTGAQGALCALSMMAVCSLAQAQDDNAQGERLFKMRCAICHNLTPENKPTGPHLYDLMGRTAGTVEGYRYSQALVKSEVVWSRETVDKFIENSRQFIPGSRMAAPPIRKPEDRTAIIDYIVATATPPEGEGD